MIVKIGKLIVFVFLLTFSAAYSAQAATSIPFTINLSEAVNVTGTPRIAVDVGGVTRYATYTSGTGSSALTFTYAMVAGDVDLDGVTLTSPIDLNGGTMKDLSGNDLSPLTYTVPNTSNVKVNYPSLGMDFIYDADGRYTLNGTVYNDLTSFLSAAGGTFTRASTATYYDSTGTLQTAASGAPRFDYDPVTHTAKGILIEESRTNSIINSPLAQAGTATASTISGPNGVVSGYKFLANGTNANHAIYYGAQSTISGTAYTESTFIKAGTQTLVQIGVSSSVVSSGNAYTNFNLANQTIVNGASITSSGIISLPNGWFRIWATFTANNTGGGASGQISTITSTSDTKTPANTSSGDFYVYGPQREVGSFPTSYIPTTAAAVTRQADVLSIPTGSWTDATKGTLLGIFQQPTLISVHPTYIATVGNNSASNFSAIYLNAASGKNAVVNTSGVDQYNQIAGTYVAGSTSKLGLAYQANDFRGSMDGTFTTAGSSGTIPSVSALRIGDRDGTRTLNGTVQMFKYYPARVANTQLQTMTQ